MLNFTFSLRKKSMKENDTEPLTSLTISDFGLVDNQYCRKSFDRYRITIDLYTNKSSDIKDMDIAEDFFRKNKNLLKEFVTKRLYQKNVLANGYLIKENKAVLAYLSIKYTVELQLTNAIFIINGSGGCGKDTFVDYVKNHIPSTYKLQSISTIDPVRNMLADYGIDTYKKTERDRLLLSEIKSAIMKYDPYYSFKNTLSVFNRIFQDPYEQKGVIFVHCREKEDIDRLKKLGAYTILIKNDNVSHITSNESDKNVFDYNYDFIISNNGTLEEIEQKAKDFCSIFEEFDLEYNKNKAKIVFEE